MAPGELCRHRLPQDKAARRAGRGDDIRVPIRTVCLVDRAAVLGWKIVRVDQVFDRDRHTVERKPGTIPVHPVSRCANRVGIQMSKRAHRRIPLGNSIQMGVRNLSDRCITVRNQPDQFDGDKVWRGWITAGSSAEQVSWHT